LRDRGVIRSVHIHEFGAEHLIGETSKRAVCGKQVEMVFDDHQVSEFQTIRNATRRIREEGGTNTQGLGNPDRDGHRGSVIALVVMKATRKTQDSVSTDAPRDKLAGMPLDCRHREPRNLDVGNDCPPIHPVHEARQTRSEDDSNLVRLPDTPHQAVDRDGHLLSQLSAVHYSTDPTTP